MQESTSLRIGLFVLATLIVGLWVRGCVGIPQTAVEPNEPAFAPRRITDE